MGRDRLPLARVMLRLISVSCALALIVPSASSAHAQAVPDPVAAPAPRPAPCLAGVYDGGALDIAATLALSPEGRFRYALSRGALNEEARGHWESVGDKVFLTSDPATPAGFTLVSEMPGAPGAFRLALDLPDGISPQYFNAVLTMKDGSTKGHPLGYEDWIVPLTPGEAVVSVKLQLPPLDLESERFVLSAGSAVDVRFAFAPGDLGRVAFTHEPLAIDSGVLVLDRAGRRLRFRPESGGC